MNKKMIAMMLTLSMLAAGFAGCLGGDDDDTTDDTTTDDTTTDDTTTDDTTTDDTTTDDTTTDDTTTDDTTTDDTTDTTPVAWTGTPAASVSAVIVTSDWDPIIPNLLDGTMCDAIISAMTKTAEREAMAGFTFSRGYTTSSQGVLGGANAADITSVADLNASGVTIGLQSGTTSDIYAAENLALATVTAFTDFPSVFTALSNGDVDYVMGDSPVLALEGTLMTTFSDETFGVGVRESSPQLLDAINVAITGMVESGEWDTISTAWDLLAPLTDDTTADTATAYPTVNEGSDLAAVLESGQLKFCSDTSYPPYESLSDGVAVGFDVDIADAIAKHITDEYIIIEGCMDATAVNYNPAANTAGEACVWNTDLLSAAIPACTAATCHKIGLLYDSTGGIANFAPAFNFAVAEAFNDLNAQSTTVGFDMVYGDTQCNEQAAATAAQALIDSGVIGVAGAACSDATKGANSVLSAANIPMVSFASTSPSLSDASSYPHFFRVVPSDAIQGQAMAAVVSNAGVMNPYVAHMQNSYGSGLADGFETAFLADSDNSLCGKQGYNQDDFSDPGSIIQAIADAGDCDGVVLASYSADGATIIQALAYQSISLPTFAGDGMAGTAALTAFSAPAASNGLVTTSPRAGSSTGDFPATCAADAVCDAGIFTSEAYDAVMIIGAAAGHESGANMAMHLSMEGSGDGYAGASGTHVFLTNGDVAGSGYDVCGFHHIPTYGEYYNCEHVWTATDGLAAAPDTRTSVKIGFLGDATSPAIGDYWTNFQGAAMIGLGLANTIAYNQNIKFEIVWGDTACNEQTAATAAQTLVDSGVWGVVGAACSDASKGANSVLSANGIPMISYASTSAALSDESVYPDFYRVVPSDAGQSAALADLLEARGEDTDGVAVIAASNSYSAGLADGFAAEWADKGNTLCTRANYDHETQTDFSAQAQSLNDNGCTSVLLVSYNADGAAIITALDDAGWSGQIYGTDGIAEVAIAESMDTNSLLNGVIATKPASAEANAVSDAFNALCVAPNPCAGGIFVAEAFDAVTIMAFSAFTFLTTPGLTPGQAVLATGNDWTGASGSLTFLSNGDTPGSGYCVGTYAVDAADAVTYTCTQHWGANGLTDL